MSGKEDTLQVRGAPVGEGRQLGRGAGEPVGCLIKHKRVRSFFCEGEAEHIWL